MGEIRQRLTAHTTFFLKTAEVGSVRTGNFRRFEEALDTPRAAQSGDP